MHAIKLLLLLTLLSSIGHAQTDYELINDSLSAVQCDSLNVLFEVERAGRDFHDMKVAFFYSPGGSVQRMSESFFQNPAPKHVFIVFFEEKDKQQHGYDCMIVYGAKYAPIKGNNRRLKKLKRKTSLKQ